MIFVPKFLRTFNVNQLHSLLVRRPVHLSLELTQMLWGRNKPLPALFRVWSAM